MSVKVKYKNSTLADIKVGQKVKLPCSGYVMESDVEVIPQSEEVNGTVNGEIVQQVVADGKSISKGDFVELVNTGKAFRFLEKGSSSHAAVYFDAVLLDDNTIVYVKAMNSTGVYAALMRFENGQWIEKTRDIGIDNLGNKPVGIKIAAASEKTILVFVAYDSNSARVYVVHIEDDFSIRPVKTNALYIADASATYQKLFRLDGEYFVVHYVRSERSFIKVLRLSENDTISVHAETLWSGNGNIVPVSANEFLWLKESRSTTDDTRSYVVSPVKVSNGVMLFSDASFAISSPNKAISYVNCVTSISEQNFIFLKSIVHYVDETFTLLRETNTILNSGAFASISDTEYVYKSGDSRIKLGNLESDEVSSDPLSVNTDSKILVTSSSSVIVFQYVEGLFLPYKISDGNITVDSGDAQKIQPATSSRFMYGLALESGEAGEAINVAVPSIE